MNYSVNKLKFKTPVHFGGDSALSLENAQMSFCADTLFSALCHTAALSEGAPGVEWLCTAVERGELLLSDGLPWQGDELYLPRPFAAPTKRAEIPAEQRKSIKKVKYIPADKYEAYMRLLSGGESLNDDELEKIKEYRQNFGVANEQTRAMVPEQGDTEPYFVGTYSFYGDCGLYFILGYAQSEMEQRLSRLLRLLGYSGMGGKVSSGYGKFEVEHVPLAGKYDWLSRALNDERAPMQIALSACLPKDEELDSVMEGAQYQLLRRGGFVSDVASDAQPGKKDTQYVFGAGSVFARRFDGQLSRVGSSAGHAVYRYNRPVWLGVRT